MLVVDMPVQVSLGTEPHLAVLVRTFVRSLVISLMMTETHVREG
jgi:hypothetical protein